jgi:hypothetical protein
MEEMSKDRLQWEKDHLAWEKEQQKKKDEVLEGDCQTKLLEDYAKMKVSSVVQ